MLVVLAACTAPEQPDLVQSARGPWDRKDGNQQDTNTFIRSALIGIHTFLMYLIGSHPSGFRPLSSISGIVPHLEDGRGDSHAQQLRMICTYSCW